MTDTDINLLIDRLNDRQRREFALWCAERVRHLMTDPRSTDALDVVARHLRGEATDAELAAAADAAWAAAAARAKSAAWSAAAWARDAAWSAADAAWSAAWDAPSAAARDAARAAAAAAVALAPPWDAAWDAERAAQFAELNRLLEETKR